MIILRLMRESFLSTTMDKWSRARSECEQVFPFTIYYLPAFPLHLPVEPGLGHAPVPIDGYRCYAQNFSCLFYSQAAKISQLDDPAFQFVNHAQFRQGVIQRNEFRAA